MGGGTGRFGGGMGRFGGGTGRFGEGMGRLGCIGWTDPGGVGVAGVVGAGGTACPETFRTTIKLTAIRDRGASIFIVFMVFIFFAAGAAC